MFKLKSVAGRIAIGMGIGIVAGLLVIWILPAFDFPLWSTFGFGTLIMFFLMGAMIGFVGQFDRHPVFDFKMKWWFRAPFIGALFMLMYVLLSYNSIEVLMESALISWMGLSSPYWALLDGLFLGGLMGWAETKLAGEGSELPMR